MPSLHETLKAPQERVERALAARLAITVEAPAARLLDAMRYATLNGGKRIRACLIYAAGEAVGADAAMLDDAARLRARELEAAALESLRPLGDNGRSLRTLARYIVQREQ